MSRRPYQLEASHLVIPNGRRIALDAIEDWAMAAWGGQQRIVTPKWSGWRVVQQYLVPPGRTMQNGGIHINHFRAMVQAGHVGPDPIT